MSDTFMKDRVNDLEARIERLLEAANIKTQINSTNLTAATRLLIANYGVGDGTTPEYDGEYVIDGVPFAHRRAGLYDGLTATVKKEANE